VGARSPLDTSVLAALISALPACSSSGAVSTAVGILWLAGLTVLFLYQRRTERHRQRRRVLTLLAAQGELDGGEILERTDLRFDDLVTLTGELDREGLVVHLASVDDPVWRDHWKLTDAGRRAAAQLAVTLCLLLTLTACAMPEVDAHEAMIRDGDTASENPTACEAYCAPHAWLLRAETRHSKEHGCTCYGAASTTAWQPSPRAPVPAVALSGSL
jgi:hypothetical protein